MLDLKPIVRAILKEYALPRHGIHGIAHWGRVLDNGVRLAETTPVNVDIVRLFAVFHDSQRVTEETDPSHGLRGATLAAELRGKLFDLSEDDFDLLYVACAGHMERPTDDDPTVQLCWDADRLDLGRVGMTIDPSWLGATTLANPALLQWAVRRATSQAIPEWLERDWGIKADRSQKVPARRSGKKAR
jgi:uncharacterized protein